MDFETAQVSLIGDRVENQDRAKVLVGDECALAIVADGMGGHADGALAAETAIGFVKKTFCDTSRPQPDPNRFLNETIAGAHAEVLALGEGMPLEVKPGTTIVCALFSKGKMRWAHVGDSRAYHLRAGKLLVRTHDHTEVETLVETGHITPAEAGKHPSRHVVDYCLGVAPEKPLIALSKAIKLAVGDIVLLCSDGLWSQTEEAHMCEKLGSHTDLQASLAELAGEAAQASSPHSDNVTAVALRVNDA
ncbi:MAG: PP2C family protein-serine/threonine phosphatase [Gammaproteobacteria bacterium]